MCTKRTSSNIGFVNPALGLYKLDIGTVNLCLGLYGDVQRLIDSSFNISIIVLIGLGRLLQGF